MPPALAPRVDISSAWRLAVSVVRRSDGRSAEDRRWLEMLGEDGGKIGEAIEPAGKFSGLIRDRPWGELTDWLVRVEGSSVAGLRSFARSLRLAEAAVRAGVTVEWSNGPVEGQANRLEVIKRTTYGSARFDLFEARGVHAGWMWRIDPGEREAGGVTCFGMVGPGSSIRRRGSGDSHAEAPHA